VAERASCSAFAIRKIEMGERRPSTAPATSATWPPSARGLARPPSPRRGPGGRLSHTGVGGADAGNHRPGRHPGQSKPDRGFRLERATIRIIRLRGTGTDRSNSMNSQRNQQQDFLFFQSGNSPIPLPSSGRLELTGQSTDGETILRRFYRHSGPPEKALGQGQGFEQGY